MSAKKSTNRLFNPARQFASLLKMLKNALSEKYLAEKPWLAKPVSNSSRVKEGKNSNASLEFDSFSSSTIPRKSLAAYNFMLH
jgi:hypothetical protein